MIGVTKMSNQLAVVDNVNNGGLLNTFTLDSEQDQNRALRALNGSESLKKLGDTPFNCVDIIQAPGIAAITEEPCINTYFICDDGSSYMTQSGGINRSCHMLLALKGNCLTNNEKGYTTLQVVERPLGDGRAVKSVIPVD